MAHIEIDKREFDELVGTEISKEKLERRLHSSEVTGTM